MDLSSNWKVKRVINATAAGTTTINSTSVDMSGFESVTFLVAFGAIVAGAATSIKAQQSSDDTSFNDLKGTAVTVADTDDNKVAILEVIRPLDRYVRVVVARATQNSTIDSAVAHQGRALEAAVSHDTTVLGSELHHAPAEGTA